MLKILRDYLTLGSLATVASVVGIAGGANALFGGHGGGGGGGGGGGTGLPGSMGYVPQHQGSADDSWQQLLEQMMGGAGGQFETLMPFLQQAFGSTAGQYGDLAGLMQSFGSTLAGQGGMAYDAAGGLRGAGGQMWNAALDPENALRDRTQQRVVDSSRAATSARGIGMSPQAAGMENQAVGNFNLDWNDRQLGRMGEGMRGLTNAYDSAGRYSQLGNASLAGSAGMYQGAGALPFDLANMFSGAMSNGVYGPASGIMSNLGSYMGLGQAGSAAAFNQGQQNLGNLTQGLNSFGSSPGGSWLSNFFSPSNPSNNNYGMPAGQGGYGEGFGPG